MSPSRSLLAPLFLATATLLSFVACADDSSAPSSCASSLTFTPAEPRLATGDSLLLAAATSGGCGGSSFTWTSSDPTIISIDPETGVIRAHLAGGAFLYVASGTSSDAIDSVKAVAYAPLFDRLIFARQDAPGGGDPTWGVWTSDTSGRDLILLLDSLNYPQHPRVSPDGKSIVFEDWGELFVIDAGGGARRRLETGVNVAFAPAWSPHGEWILFTGGSSLNPPWQMYRMRMDGSPPSQLTGTILGTHAGAWSPDDRIVYVRYNAIGLDPVFLEAVVMDTAGGELEVLTGEIPDFRGSYPAWSPDGQSILFMDVAANDWVVTKLTLAGLRYDTLGSAAGNRPGEWSPDGQRIVYGTGDLWLMNADGSNKRVVLSDGALNFEVAWTPAAPPR